MLFLNLPLPDQEEDAYLDSFFVDPPSGPDLTDRVMAEIHRLPLPSPPKDLPLLSLIPLLTLSLVLAGGLSLLLAQGLDFRFVLDLLHQAFLVKEILQGVSWIHQAFGPGVVLDPLFLFSTTLVLSSAFLIFAKLIQKRRMSHDHRA